MYATPQLAGSMSHCARNTSPQALAQPGETAADQGEQVGGLGEDGQFQVDGGIESILSALSVARVQAKHEQLGHVCVLLQPLFHGLRVRLLP